MGPNWAKWGRRVYAVALAALVGFYAMEFVRAVVNEHWPMMILSWLNLVVFSVRAVLDAARSQTIQLLLSSRVDILIRASKQASEPDDPTQP